MFPSSPMAVGVWHSHLGRGEAAYWLHGFYLSSLLPSSVSPLTIIPVNPVCCSKRHCLVSEFLFNCGNSNITVLIENQRHVLLLCHSV